MLLAGLYERKHSPNMNLTAIKGLVETLLSFDDSEYQLLSLAEILLRPDLHSGDTSR